jgi:hypothetical protein
VSRPTAFPSAFDLALKRWQDLPPFLNEVVPSQIAKASRPTSPRSHPCTVSDQLLPHAQCEPPLFKRHSEGQASPAFAQGASIDFTTKNTANRPRVSMRVETTLKIFPQSRESQRSRRLKPREGRHSRCHGREPVECWRCASGKSPSGATLLPAERVAPFRGLKTQTSKFGPPVTNRLHLGRKALVRRRLKHSSIEVDCDAHFSQADSFAVVPEPTAEPSAWETERGRCFHDHQCNQRLSQRLTADVQYVVTPMARGVPPFGVERPPSRWAIHLSCAATASNEDFPAPRGADPSSGRHLLIEVLQHNRPGLLVSVA